MALNLRREENRPCLPSRKNYNQINVKMSKYILSKGKQVLSIDKRYFRPTEVDLLIGDPTKAKTKLNWEPEYDLKSLVAEMILEDIKLFEKDVYLKKGGHYIPQNQEE